MRFAVCFFKRLWWFHLGKQTTYVCKVRFLGLIGQEVGGGSALAVLLPSHVEFIHTKYSYARIQQIWGGLWYEYLLCVFFICVASTSTSTVRRFALRFYWDFANAYLILCVLCRCFDVANGYLQIFWSFSVYQNLWVLY